MDNIHNPIISGFYPDPSICRVGDDYYIACSSFELYPGIPLFHSKDLAHWEQICNVMTIENGFHVECSYGGGGVMAPTIRYNNGTYYIMNCNFSHRGNYIVTAKEPKGPWSHPHWLEDVPGIDASLFFDDDGICYVVGTGDAWDEELGMNTCGIWIAKFDIEHFKMLGKPVTIFHSAMRGAEHPEAPHLYHIGEYYYLMIAEGGTDQHHCVAVARSKALFESFENNPDNPVMTHRMMGSYAAITNVGHADLVETQNGDWYAVMLASRNIDGKHKNLGRETYICPVVWEDGWPLFSPKTGHLEFEYEGSGLPETRYEHQIKRYEFEEKEFEPEWTWWGTPYEPFFERKDSKLNIKCVAQKLIEELKPASFDFQLPRGRENFAPFIALRETELNFSVACCMRFKPITQESAGMAIVQQMNNQYHFERIQEEGTEYLQLVRYFAEFDSRPYLPGFSSKTKCETIAKVPYDKEKVVLKLEGKGKDYTFYYGESEAELKEFAKGDSTKISTEQIGCMTGTMIGMYATGNGKNVDNQATFAWFEMI